MKLTYLGKGGVNLHLRIRGLLTYLLHDGLWSLYVEQTVQKDFAETEQTEYDGKSNEILALFCCCAQGHDTACVPEPICRLD